MALRSLQILRRARAATDGPMQLYRIDIPYRPTVTFQHRRNCSTRSTHFTNPPSQKLDMSNPLYRDLIKSIKNPFIRDSIHKLAQGETTFSESMSQDIHGTGNSIYFRVPELPPAMKGHSHDPDGIPLPPNTFRVSSTEELRSILGRILEYRENEYNAGYTRHWGENDLHKDSSVSATATEGTKEKKKEDIPSTESRKSQSPISESKISKMPDWKSLEGFDAFKEKCNQYLKTGSRLVKDRAPVSSVLEAWEQQTRKSTESPGKGNPSPDRGKTLNIDYEAGKNPPERQSYGLGAPAPSKTDPTVSVSDSNGLLGHEEIRVLPKVYTPGANSTNMELRAPQTEDPFLPYKEDIREVKETLVKLIAMMPKAPAAKSTSPSDNEDKTPEKSRSQDTDTVEQASERITLMDILNGTATASVSPSEKPKSSETFVDSLNSTLNTGTSSDSTAGLLEVISTLSEKLGQANKRISELETPSAGVPVPDFQKFTDHMDQALATQYSDLRDYFEERVLSETRDVVARVGSLEKTMQKILENQEAAAAAAQSKDGACIYSTEGGGPGEEPEVPVTVKLDEIDKAGVQQVVDTAVKTVVEKVLDGIEENKEKDKEDMVDSVVDGLNDFRNYGMVNAILGEVLDSDEISRRLDLHVKVFVGQVLEELGRDENGDLQKIVKAAVKAGTKDLEEGVKSRFGDVQLKLFGMERVLRGSRRKRKDHNEGWFW
ncbi:uncharacterized protein DFL_006937 [Arthrobotrys flagrans]|uniref:Uncharacterized protein n=1 Tax=Arthrobotrys flagrans TaxID=97331 RepID=A0A436ZUT5_ARTFL|nr:hypothetical protein DFL_006937 [Arthrobotrys flagrans]